MDDDMAGGPTRTLARSGSERRPSRRGVNTSVNKDTTGVAWTQSFKCLFYCMNTSLNKHCWRGVNTSLNKHCRRDVNTSVDNHTNSMQ